MSTVGITFVDDEAAAAKALDVAIFSMVSAFANTSRTFGLRIHRAKGRSEARLRYKGQGVAKYYEKRMSLEDPYIPIPGGQCLRIVNFINIWGGIITVDDNAAREPGARASSAVSACAPVAQKVYG
jgi:hypothetical protein